jgi:stress response protein YsnF
LDAVQGTAENAKQPVRDLGDAVKDTTEYAQQSVVGGLDAIKDKAEDIKPSDNPSLTIAKERVIIAHPPSNTDEISLGESVETQTTDIVPVPMQAEGFYDRTMNVDTETPVVFGEVDFREEPGFNEGEF